MQRNVAGAVVAALVLVLVAAGCGSTAKPPSEKAFRAQANAACSTFHRQIAALRTPGSAADQREWAQRSSRLLGELIDRLDAIHPPTSLADRYAQFKDALVAQAAAMKKMAAPGAHLDAADRRALEGHRNPGALAAEALRLQRCL